MKKIPEKALYKLLEQLGLAPEDRGDYFKVVCPSCGMKEAFAYKNNSLIMCSRRNKCSHAESVIDLARKEKALKKDILKSLGETTTRKEEIKEKTELVVPEGLTFFSEGRKDGIIYKKAYDYLVKRCIDEKIINQLGYIYNPGGEIELGIFIPFFEDEELVYYIIRNIDNSSKKRYDNPHGINATQFIYNYDNIQENGVVCISEGVFDAISITNYIGTAMLTATMNKKQASKIFDKAPSKIIYIPDNDETGKRFIKKNIEMLIRYKPPSLHTEFYIYFIPEEFKDLNEMVISNGNNFIDLNNCILYSDYKRKFNFQRKSPL